jgi:hypothetical protein
VDDVITGTSCGPAGLNGLLFNIAVKSNRRERPGDDHDQLVKLRNCNNQPMFALAGRPGERGRSTTRRPPWP